MKQDIAGGRVEVHQNASHIEHMTWARELAQRSRALGSLPEDLDVILSTHTVAHIYNSSSRVSNALF